jgi:hydroxymethylbilane synthase
LESGVLKLQAAWGDPEGTATLVTANAQSSIRGLQAAEALGLSVAQALRDGGAH